MNLLTSLAAFELELIRERVTAGMKRAKREGKSIGRPKVSDDPVKAQQLREAVQQVRSGEKSYRQAAQEAGVSLATLQRALRQ